MIKTTGSVFIGRFGQRGLWVTDTIVLGSGQSNEHKIPDIDLTAEELDPRISYICESEHSYLNESGMVATAEKNVWPLEYKNGVAVGRHEPEPEVNKDMLRVGTENMISPVTLNDGFVAHRENVGDRYHRIRLNTDYKSFVTAQITLRPAGRTNFAFRTQIMSNEYHQVALNDSALGYVGAGFINPVVEKLGSDLIILRVTYQMSNTASFFCCAKSTVVNDALPSYPGDKNLGFDLFSAQLEPRLISSSPVRNAQQSRLASSVTVETKSASSITVHYSDSSSDKYLTPGDEFILPFASKNWSERYITRVELYD